VQTEVKPAENGADSIRMEEWEKNLKELRMRMFDQELF
jgi:hypothetical protein